MLILPEVLAIIRLEKTWLYEMMNAGVFPLGYRMGRRRFWRQSEVFEGAARLLRPVQAKDEDAPRPTGANVAPRVAQRTVRRNKGRPNRTVRKPASSSKRSND